MTESTETVSAPLNLSDLPHGMRPRMAKLPLAVAYSGRSRSRLYELALEHPQLFRKDGTSTLVDFDVLDRILGALPMK
jgi:hypothetical protein